MAGLLRVPRDFPGAAGGTGVVAFPASRLRRLRTAAEVLPRAAGGAGGDGLLGGEEVGVVSSVRFLTVANERGVRGSQANNNPPLVIKYVMASWPFV